MWKPILLALWLGTVVAPSAEAGCFEACFPEELGDRVPTDATVRDAVRDCRDQCEVRLMRRLGDLGLAERYKSCPEVALSEDEVQKVRSASGPYFLMLTNWVWEVTNPFPDKVLRGIEIRHLTPYGRTVSFSTKSVIPPGESATYVITDVAELLPQLKGTLSVTGMTGCRAGS